MEHVTQYAIVLKTQTDTTRLSQLSFESKLQATLYGEMWIDPYLRGCLWEVIPV